MARIDAFLKLGLAQGCSDVHLAVGVPPMLRMNGDLMPIKFRELTDTELEAYLLEILTNKQKERLAQGHDLDFSYVGDESGRFRVNVFRKATGMGAVFRSIPGDVPTLDQLHVPPILKQFCDYHQGMVLVTGSTGTGKSTTLAAMIDYINESRNMNIISLEDPIEFVHPSKQSQVIQRELGTHVESFADGVRSAMREDPDVILVGELRDLETIRLALTAAETGHLVFGTLHTSSAAKTIDRIVDVFPAAEKEMVRAMLSESLRAVISQTLLKKVGGGRIAAHEIMIGTPAIRNLIREGKIAQMYSAIQTGQAAGMHTLDQNLADLMAKGLINKEEARFRAVQKENF